MSNTPLPEPVGFRVRVRSELGMIGRYPWTYCDARRRERTPRQDCEYDDLHTADQMRAHAAAVSAAKDVEIAQLKTVMIAAAEEIQAHWDAHCDAEGYGPANLMRRLEEGIPSQYGYTAGAFAALQERIKVLEERIKELEGKHENQK